MFACVYLCLSDERGREIEMWKRAIAYLKRKCEKKLKKFNERGKKN